VALNRKCTRALSFESSCQVNWGHWHRGDEMYEGTWSHGLKHGLGKYTDADGNKFSGKWDKDFCYFYEPEEPIPSNVNVFIPKISEFR